MSRNRQSGWIGLRDKVFEARRDDSPPGGSAGPARAVDISRGCRSAGDTDTVHRSPGPLLPQKMVRAVLLVGSSKIDQPRAVPPSTAFWLNVWHYIDRPLTGFRAKARRAHMNRAPTSRRHLPGRSVDVVPDALSVSRWQPRSSSPMPDQW